MTGALDEEVFAQILAFSAQGDDLAEQERYDEAIRPYNQGWRLIPEPKLEWEASTWLLAAIADTSFLGGFPMGIHREGKLRNLPSDARPFGRIELLAYLPTTWSRVQDLSGARFISRDDDLGASRLAICEVEGLPVFGMEQRDHPLQWGVSLFVDHEAPHPDGWSSLASEILEAAGRNDIDGTEITER